jgi:hypothetical protein
VQPNSLSILKLLLDAAPYECSYARLLEAISDVPYEIWAVRLKAIDHKARKAALFPVWRVIYNLKQPMEGLGLTIVLQKSSGYTLVNRQKTRSSSGLSKEHYTTISALN